MNRSEVHKTTCCYCGVGCGIDVERDSYGRLTVKGDESHPVNRGMLCSKGMNLHHVVMDQSDRLLYPQMRWSRSHPLERVTWDAALGRAAAVFRSLIEKFGPDSVAFYVSGQMLTEEYYVANKLMKGFIGSNNIDTNSRLCMSSAVAAYKLALGEDSVPVNYEDIEAAQCFLIAGANPAWCHPILFRRMEKLKAENPNIKIIVVDPRKTQSCSLADLHLQIYPGTDVALYDAIARCLIEGGMIDETFICNHTEGFAELSRQVMQVTLEESARICRIPAQEISQAARYIGQSKAFLSLWAMGLNQSVIGVNKNLALINLSLLTGQIGRPGAGPFSLTGQPNAMGGREVGGLANLLPAHRDLANPDHRAEVAEFWNSKPISSRPGYTATEIPEAFERGDLKAVWIVCTNPTVSMPDAGRFEKALSKARFVIVQDISARSTTLSYADLVLPAAGWLEKQGTMTNSERRVSYLPKVIDPPGDAKADSWILSRFAEKMGFGEAFAYRDESEIFAEHCRLTEGTSVNISGLSYERLKARGSVQWPCPADDHQGTPRLFADHRFPTPSGKARLHAVAPDNHSEPAGEEFPFVLTTGRLRDQWHTMTRTGKVAKLRQQVDCPLLEVHPGDARELNLAEGDIAKLSSRQGEAEVRVNVTDSIRQGVVFLPMHWGKQLNGAPGRANNLTSNLVDPRSKEPDFKFTAVKIARKERARQKVVIVGSGAAALQFIQTYREKNQEDEIHVYGREPHMFYNRVLLIEYISGRKSWDDLLTCDAETIRRLNVKFHAGMTIAKIDRMNKKIFDTSGDDYSYDALVLATGSRPFIIPGSPAAMEGVFSIRSREDADRIKNYLKPESRTVVLGGGLLGLELAAELAAVGVGVTVIQNLPMLMGRQLDDVASGILVEVLRSRGVEVILNDEIIRYYGKTAITGVRTRGGITIPCDLLFLATGIRPNIELGATAGLDHRRGLIVDDHLRTSDPSVYAIGEIAEHNECLYGTTPSANDQSKVAAAHIAGDPWAIYRGSVLFNILKIQGFDVCSVGVTIAPQYDPSWEEVVLIDRRRQYYKKCVTHRDRLVGTILMGDRSEFAEYRQLIESGIELDEVRHQLLRSTVSSSRQPIIGPVVCSCNSVGQGNIQKFIDEGCTELESLCRLSQAGTGCGSCRPEVQALLHSQLALAS